MKLTADITTNLNTQGAIDIVSRAGRVAMTKTIAIIANESIHHSPHLTGNNARSIMYETGPGGVIAKDETEGAVYSTSGYGGFLETGTVSMAARPYMKPALDRNRGKLMEFLKAGLM